VHELMTMNGGSTGKTDGCSSQGHRRTSQGARGCSPLIRTKPLFFRAKANFFGQKPTAKMKKMVFIKRKNEMFTYR